MEAQGDTNPFYADGIVYFRTTANNGYSGDLEIALIPQWFREQILKEIVDSNGVLVENSDDIDPVYFALLFEFDGDINAIRHVMYNCTISSRPTVESSTKEESIEPGTETLSISADPREDGLVKARTGDDTDSTVYSNWYLAVYTPNSTMERALLSGLTITGVTLTPTFDDEVYAYTGETESASNMITASAASGFTVGITVNGSEHESGTAATWVTGNNNVEITVSKTGYITTTYKVTVVKAAG